jgi:ubiquinone/menaquinone biosynthesis C-methylase UbiE
MTATVVPESLWDRHARDWTCLQEAKHRPLRRALLGALGSLSGVRLLDVGCGVGLLIREAAERGAWVAGVDTADELLEVARWALPDADLRVGSPEDLPYDNGRFDVVTACNTLCYTLDRPAALSELVRVVRPGGRVAIGDWADPSGSLTRDFLSRLGFTPSTEDTELARVDAGELQFPITYPDLATAWSAMLARGQVATLAWNSKTQIYQHFTDVFGPAVRPDGTIRDDNAFRYLIAEKPV